MDLGQKPKVGKSAFHYRWVGVFSSPLLSSSPIDIGRLLRRGYVTRVWSWTHPYIQWKVNVKWSRYRPGVAQRVGRGIALLFHDRGTRRGWVVSNTPRPHFTPRKDPVPILQEAVWAPGPVWTGGKSRPHRDSIPDRPGRNQSLHWLRYPVHTPISSAKS